MTVKSEMHPKILQRRMAVGMRKLQTVEDLEPWDIVSHYEGKLPRPENYRKKTVSRLRVNLRKLDEYLKLIAEAQKRDDSTTLVELSDMYQRHRGYVVKELGRRIVKRGGR